MRLSPAFCLSLVLAAPAAAQRADEWALHGHDLGGQRFSPLTAIDTGTVRAWCRSGPTTAASPPPFRPPRSSSTAHVRVAPVQRRRRARRGSGRERWRYTHVSRVAKPCCGPANRGVAVADGLVYVGTVDGRLVALDAGDRGRAMGHHRRRLSRHHRGDQPSSRADDPLSQVGRDRLDRRRHQRRATGGRRQGVRRDRGRGIRPPSRRGSRGRGGRGPVRPARAHGRVRCPHRRAGLALGRDRARLGGALPCRHARRRAAAAAAWPRSARPRAGTAMRGDTAAGRSTPPRWWTRPATCSSSAPAIPRPRWPTSPVRATTCTPPPSWRWTSGPAGWSWYYQQVPHDRWGYDVASSPVLLEVTWQGQRIPAVAQASKTGWVFVHDRRTGALLFKSEPFVPQRNLFTPPQPDAGVVIAPGIAGGANWSPSAFDPAHGCSSSARCTCRLATSRTRRGAPTAACCSYASTQNTGEAWGTLTALDLGDGGRRRWQVRTDEPLVGGVLATAGGLVFSGAGRGRFAAFDALTGRRALVVPVRRGRERAAGRLCGGRGAVRRRGGGRQRALRLHPGRHGRWRSDSGRDCGA